MYRDCTADSRSDLLKRTGYVTLLTEFSKATIVHVVDLVAADAGAAQCYFSWHGFVVTGIAGNTRVSPVQNECGLFVVIETPGLPRQSVMTGFTARPKRVLMFVVFLMTADAGNTCVLEGRRGVALLAFDAGVLA